MIVSCPGTVTVGGAVTVTARSAVCGTTATCQSPAPSPASDSATSRVAVSPGRTSPNVTELGSANSSGRSAFGRSTMPPPSRVAGVSTFRVESS